VTQILAADNGQVTAAQIAADLDITEPQAYRLLNEVRAAA
jgi:predicted DNA-binding transcriptional regulator YafY